MGGPEAISIAYTATQSLIFKARKAPIALRDLHPLADYMKSANILADFDQMMKKVVWRAPKQRDPAPNAEGSMSFAPAPDTDDAFVPLNTPEEVETAIAASKDRMRLYFTQGYSLLNLMIRLTAPHNGLAILLGLVRTAFIILQAWALWTIVRIVGGDPDYQYSTGVQYVIALMLPIAAYVQSIAQQNSFHVCTRAGLISRALATALIYEKVRAITPLQLGAKSEKTKKVAAIGASPANGLTSPAASPSSREPVEESEEEAKARKEKAAAELSTGQLVNLVSSDANAVVEAFIMSAPGLLSVVDISACVVWIGWVGGWAAAPLVGAVFLVLAFQVFCGFHVAANKQQVGKVTDKRLRSLTEFLAGIQVVKFYAWEGNVRKMINDLRSAEAGYFVAGNIWKLFALASVFFANGIFIVVVFGCKLTYDKEMGAGDTFLIMTLVGYISRGFFMLPRSLTCLATASASTQRIQSLLSKDVITGLPDRSSQDEHANDQTPKKDAALYDEEMPTKDAFTTAGGSRGLHVAGDFGWSGFAVRDLNLVCPEGSLTVVIGSVGSGKSTLLQAVLGVCGALSPHYKVELPGDGRIAYVAQEAFIYDSTVRENITFGLPWDEAKYRRVIKACSLVTDFQQWGGDLVEVTGGTLSGGQRQRLSLARACYADAPLYIVDDPISAVDAAVGRHLLQHCFRGYLKGKTVLLSTHHPAPARFADQVVVMEQGSARICPMSAEAKEAVRQMTTEHPEVAEHALAASDVESAIHRLETESVSAGEPEMRDLYEEGEDEETEKFAAQDAILDELIGKSRQLRQTEVEAAGSVGLGIYAAYIKGGGWTLALTTLVLFVFSQGVKSVQDWWVSAWTRRMYPELNNDQYLYILGILAAALVVLSFARTISFGYFTINSSSDLHDRMFEAIIASPLHFFEQVPIGRIMNRFSKDLDYCDDLLPRTLFDVLQNILFVIGAIALLIYSVPWFAIAVPFALLFFGFLIYSFLPASRYLKRIEGTSRSPTMNTFQTVIAGLTTLRVYNRLDFFQDVFFRASDDTTNALIHSNSAQRWMGIRTDWVAALWVLLVAFLSIGLRDSLGPSKVGLGLSQSLSFTGLLQYTIRMIAETENLMTSVERIDEYSHLSPEENNGTITAAPPAPPNATAVQLNEDETKQYIPANWPEGCDIVAKDLTVAYHSNPGVPVLKNLHFTIRAGQRVAVVGRTGAGKSSLLSCFYRTVKVPDGAISIGGVSITDMDVFCLRSRIGVIPQVPTLFHGTFRYNLDPFGQFTDEAMTEALRKVRLEAYVNARAGLDTAVGDGGANLSVGQRQLLCAARVLLTGASILFMDEATANIDEETDAQIQDIIREEAARRCMTVITIAHRLNTIMDYDLVLVLSQGRLVEFGNPQALVAAGTSGPIDSAQMGETHHDGFTTNVQSLDEVRQFARMVQTMNETHNQ